MLVESLRPFLYPIGFVANFLFAARFFLQWIQSEKKKESVVSKEFWRISFFANFLMCIHGYIQLQYPICLIQGLNACIAWRNLNLMGNRSCRLKSFLTAIIFTPFFLTALFWLQGSNEWMRPPAMPWNGNQAMHAGIIWHLLGCFGMFLFASRYWVQWWFSEKKKKSVLGKSFWWISCVGAIFSLIYALRLKDPVNILGFGLGVIPYIRNLMLFRKPKVPAAKKSNSLFLFAGEQSGDVLGGNLVNALKKAYPSLELFGVGGPEMKKGGMLLTQSMERFQVMGFTDVLKALPRLYAEFRKIQKEILSKQPAAVILIDYPDFNMLLARALRKKGYTGKVIHYVCPSVWAWRKGRMQTLVNNLDHLLAILPFEQDLFSKTSLPVTFVGHPLVAAIDRYNYDPTWRPANTKPLIALFPGSRRHEIELNLPLQIESAKKLGPNYSIAISVARPDLSDLIQKHADSSMLLVPGSKRYELMREAKGAIATSGTIILELGLHSVPTIVTYQLATLNYLLGRYAFRIHLPFYSLVNIICGKEVYPEFIHKVLSPEAISAALTKLMAKSDFCQKECSRLRELLTSADASLKAADTIYKELAHAMPLS